MRIWLSFLIGLVFGSFANVCIVRLPAEKSLWFPRSHCPACGRTIKAVHNIPLLSFLALKGRCRFCHQPISWQYPLVEMIFGILFLFHAWYFSAHLDRVIVADVLGFVLLTISIIDYRHKIIPDELSLSLIGVGLAFSWINPFFGGAVWMRFLQSVGAALTGGLSMLGLAIAGEKAFKKEALGGGDVKLIAAIGAMLGWEGLLGALILGSLSGGLIAGILLVLKRKKWGESLPFGPFLSFGAYLSCLIPGWHVFFF